MALKCNNCNTLKLADTPECEICGSTEFVEVVLDDHNVTERLAMSLEETMTRNTVLVEKVEITKSEVEKLLPRLKKAALDELFNGVEYNDVNDINVKGFGPKSKLLLQELINNKKHLLPKQVEKKEKKMQTKNTAHEILDQMHYQFQLFWPEDWQKAIRYKKTEEGIRVLFWEKEFYLSHNKAVLRGRLRSVANHMNGMIVPFGPNKIPYRCKAEVTTVGVRLSWKKLGR